MSTLMDFLKKISEQSVLRKTGNITRSNLQNSIQGILADKLGCSMCEAKFIFRVYYEQKRSETRSWPEEECRVKDHFVRLDSMTGFDCVDVKGLIDREILEIEPNDKRWVRVVDTVGESIESAVKEYEESCSRKK